MKAARDGTRSVLIVCLGNICRSPMAEGILRTRAAEAGLALHVDSAGTAGYHVGEPPDARAIRVARSNGTPIDTQRARQFDRRDFNRFDLVLAADASNLRDLQALQPADSNARLALLLEWAGLGEGLEVPDPYYGRIEAFEEVHALLDQACRRMTARLLGMAECEGNAGADGLFSFW
jgi:protein-tyrosine phosphatase